MNDSTDGPDPPVVLARRVTNLRENDLLVVRCPFCGKAHRHGAGGKNSPPGAGDGTRTADCGGGEYDVQEAA